MVTITAGDRLTQRHLELAGAVVALRDRGLSWTDIAEGLGLRDEYDAQRLAARYLMAEAVAERARAAGGRMRPVQYPPAELGRG